MSDGFADDELVLTDWEEGYYARQCEEDDVAETLRVELVNLRNELIRTRAAAATLRKWGETWRAIAWGYELAEGVQIFDNKQQLWATSRPRDCMGRRLDE